MTTQGAIREWVATFLVWIGRLDALSLELRIANSRVMGAAAVNVTATLMASVGVAQLLGYGGSQVLSTIGGPWLDLLWSWTFLIAWAMVMLSRWRAKKDAVDAAWLEIGGTLLIAAVFALFTIIVIKYSQAGAGALFLIMAFMAQTINLLGRGLLLWRRIIWLGKAVEQ